MDMGQAVLLELVMMNLVVSGGGGGTESERDG